MKKSSWFIYGFYIFYLNFFTWYTWANDSNIGIIINKCYSFKDILKVIVLLCICILINLVIYKLVTKKHKFSKKYLLIPICIMLFGLFVGISLGALRYIDNNSYSVSQFK